MDTLQTPSIIAAFDLDGTLIVTKSGRRFPVNEEDWNFFSSNVIARLTALVKGNDFQWSCGATGASARPLEIPVDRLPASRPHRIVVFSNQKGIAQSQGLQRRRQFQLKLEAIAKQLAIPMDIFVATEDDIYRKPRLGMWQWLEKQLVSEYGAKPSALLVDRERSFFVGDAAGRCHNWKGGRMRDFSAGDYRFAMNAGIGFLTPEEFFLMEELKSRMVRPTSAHSVAALKAIAGAPLYEPPFDSALPKGDKVEVILLVGSPTIGKSTFSRTYLQPNEYEIINQDTLGTLERCMHMCERALQERRPVVIDNTNPTKQVRQGYIQLAQKLGISVRCFVFQATDDLIQHLNIFRALSASPLTKAECATGAPKRTKIPAIAYAKFKERFEPPSLSEGFSEIRTVNFIPNFQSVEDRLLFSQYLLEK